MRFPYDYEALVRDKYLFSPCVYVYLLQLSRSTLGYLTIKFKNDSSLNIKVEVKVNFS